MPPYFFHINDDVVLRDEEGLELADDSAAHRAALAGARAMMCDEVMKGRLVLHYRIEVEHQAGGRVLTLRFADAIAIEPQPA